MKIPSLKITTAITLSLFCLLLPARSYGQTPTPSITVTPTPTVTVTPSPGHDPTDTLHLETPSPTVTVPVPDGQPSPAQIPTQFQPPSHDNPQMGQVIEWVPYQPSGDGPEHNNKWPVIVVLHIGGYKTGNYYESLHHVPEDLQCR